MLVLARKIDQSVFIDGRRIKVTVLSVRGDQVRLGFVADPTIRVMREEVIDRIERECQPPSASSPAAS